MPLKLIGAGLAAATKAAQSAAKTAAKSASSSTTKSQPKVSNVDVVKGNTPKPGTPESHQAWINNPYSGQGGMDNYVSKQQDKWNMAVASGDYDMIDRLYADMNRVGYSLNTGSREAPREEREERGGGGGYYEPRYDPPPMPTMRSGRDMATQLGVKYDYDYIKKLMEDAVSKQYANLDTEYGRTQDMYYDNIASNADVLMGTLRRGDRDAVQAGTTEGTQAAQELSTMLGISAEATQGATELAQGRTDLVTKREAAMSKVAEDALKYYNDLGMNLGQLSASELNALITGYASLVATEGGVYNTDILAGVERDRMKSQESIADKDRDSRDKIADKDRDSRDKIAEQDRISRETIAQWNNASNEAISQASGRAQVEVEEIRERYNMAIADINAETTRIGYARNSGSGGSSGSYGNPADPTLSPMERINAMYGLIAAGAFEGDQKKLEFVQRALLDDLGLWNEYEQKTIKDVMHPTGSFSSNPYDAIIKNYTIKKNPTKKDVEETWYKLNEPD